VLKAAEFDVAPRNRYWQSPRVVAPFRRAARLTLLGVVYALAASAGSERPPGLADTDPENDEVVAPPQPIADCEERLRRAGVSFAPAELPLRPQKVGYMCGAEQALVYRAGPTRIRYNGAPTLTCGMALALADFERLLQEEAQRHLGKRVVRIEHGGTYSCRKMTRYTTMVSEHSYGNAIDLRSFTLEDGRRISVERHFVRQSPRRGAAANTTELDQEPQQPHSRFLRAVARRAYDDGVFSVVLTPYFDRLHRDHFHLDLARYRVDGTR
jgi:hypothetical protein